MVQLRSLIESVAGWRCLPLVLLIVSLAGPAAWGAEPAKRTYIVQLRQPAAIATPFEGQPRERFDPRDPAVRSYAGALVASHDELLASIGAADAKIYSYRFSFNGFAARLTVAQAAELAANPAVARVWEDELRTLRSNSSPAALGLFDPARGLRTALGLKGEDIVIGVIDSGITTGHASFADTEPGARPRACRSEWARESLLGRWLCRRFRNRINLVYQPPRDWFGRCEAGEGFPASTCNNKLVGARFYADGFAALYDMDPNEFMSPRDADGHGSHIASVAAGNPVKASLGGEEVASISGMAPRARIAVYKACWLQPGATRGTCAMSDLQRAIEDAIADGVHVINYSVGTTTGSPLDPDAQALLAASDAGVVAVAAAGNGGPLVRSVESPASSPWVIAVGAASRTGTRYDDALRVTAPAAAVGDLSMREAAFTPTLRTTGAVEGELVRADDGDPEEDRDDATADDACQELVNAAALAGRIALVRRGLCDFQDKIERAEAAGALAVVVYSNGPSLVTMSGTRGSVDIPAVMISLADGESLAGRLDDGESVAVRMAKGRFVARSDAGNVLAAESARGPNPLLPDVLKPDLAAPGTDILGAQTPAVANGVRGEAYQYLSGTSMAVPHVAGIAALLMEAHPDWRPAAIRSALVTSARQDLRRQDGATTADPFDAGGGYLVPNAAVDPGLVYDAGTADYDAFACGAGIARVGDEECAALAAAGYPTEPWNLNLPSIASGDLVTTRTVRRRVTNVGAAATYRVSVIAPPGVGASVSPGSIALSRGETAEFTVDFENLGDEARLGQWSFGALTWSSGEKSARIPIAIRPEALEAPLAVAGNGVAGGIDYDVRFGYTGGFEARATSLAVPAIYPGFVTDDPLDLYVILTDDATLPDHVQRLRVTVPEGTRYLRIAAAGVDVGADDDIDLYVFCPDGSCPDGSEVLASAAPGAEEVIDLIDPQPGEYVIDVHGFETDDEVGGPGANYEVGVWTVRDSGGAADVAVSAPAFATTGGSGTVSLTWQGLVPGEAYLGLVSYGDGGDEDLGATLLEILAQ